MVVLLTLSLLFSFCFSSKTYTNTLIPKNVFCLIKKPKPDEAVQPPIHPPPTANTMFCVASVFLPLSHGGIEETEKNSHFQDQKTGIIQHQPISHQLFTF